MAAQPVEWVLVIYYGPSAHRATYGRLDGRNTKYTKDYIQLSRKADFLEAVSSLFPADDGTDALVPLTYQWPKGTTPGALVFKSADRPHLKWETRFGAPKAWRMSLTPSDATEETIPGDPSQLEFSAAESELALLASRGAGQPYLLAIKLRDEPRKLHLRAYLKNPSEDYAWSNLKLLPLEIQALAEKTSQRSALESSILHSGGTFPTATIEDAIARIASSESPVSTISELDRDTGNALASYLRSPAYGLFFDPSRNHDAWLLPSPVYKQTATLDAEFFEALEALFPPTAQGDAAAEAADIDPSEVEVFREQIEQKNYEVADSTATVKTRGSAQRVFSEAVKANYGYRCAVTGVATKDFLVASHIVPWSKDQSIRLDPSNGICLSLIIDRAFEKGYLEIDDDLTIRVNREKVGDDQALRSQLEPYDRQRLRAPEREAPQPVYLQRRRALVNSASDI